ncbi:hypothetical protein NIIDMKKI_12550 [Mycobacterium kansasii]|uniref:Uncharacterized protein n=1 Tax=Mycobacterium kansasii TaxID=1768 RepID=A0A7G1I955_MYCKA|nr:hypothetical protein NIIDMKKI_12550 [Mycobacterium kansasii]
MADAQFPIPMFIMLAKPPLNESGIIPEVPSMRPPMPDVSPEKGEPAAAELSDSVAP